MKGKDVKKLLATVICIITVITVSGCDFFSANDSIAKTNKLNKLYGLPFIPA